MKKKRILFLINRNLVCFALFLALVTWASFAQYKQYSIIPASNHKPIYRGLDTEKRLALAINIDWGEEYLPQMLDLMEEKGIKVTFFPTGTWLKKNPELAKELAQRGHEIGNHGSSHKNATSLNDRALIDLIEGAGALVEEICGVECRLFAPPSGDVDERVAKIAASLGYETIIWTIDTIDWQKPSPATIIERVISKLEAGAIILAHPTQPTAEALGSIFDIARELGYEFVTVGEIIN